MCKATKRQNVGDVKNVVAVKDLPDIKDIRGAIPKHCFQRSMIRGFALIARDSIIAFALGYAAWNYLPRDDLSNPIQALAWVVYALLQGTVLTGLWVMGHECGHQAFSDYEVVNDSVGLVVHSMLLVPYHSWKYSHAKHHARCNHLLDGETHNPDLQRKVFGIYRKVFDVIGEEAFALLQVVAHLLIGWPMYLIMNATGSRRRQSDKQRYKKTPNHFNPYSELFPEKMRGKIALSSAALTAWIGTLSYIAQQVGTKEVMLMYFYPYLVVNAWLVGYTWLQHTSTEIPFYGEDTWTWLRGALATVDRPYPGLISWMHHEIGTTHVCHHLFSSMPCYHAGEATQHLKKFLGPLYNYDDTPVLKALFTTARDCHFVEDLSGVQYPKSVGSVIAEQKKL